MMPPATKSEAEKSLEEAIRAYAERQKTETKDSLGMAGLHNSSNSYSDENRQRTRNDTRNIYFDIAIIVLLSCSALFTGLAWWVFREQLQEMEKAYAPIKEIAEAAKASADAARASAEAAKASVESVEKATETRLRAYVDIADIGINITQAPVNNDAKLVGVLVIKNFGATPSNVDISARTVFGKYPLGPSLLPEPSGPMITARFAPGQERRLNVQMEEPAITPEQRTAWDKETIAAYFYGTIKYDDVFKRTCAIAFRVLRTWPTGITAALPQKTIA
jgi:hypothetical protein